MKRFFFSILFIGVAETMQAQNVGIGTTTPKARLHVADSSVLFSAAGDVPVSGLGNPPISGEGRRMMWYSDKAAFRAGYISSNLWDKDSIGLYSVAFGRNTKALDYGSVAMGTNTVAGGAGATAMGLNSKATVYCATAMGQNAIAGGGASIAMGNFVTAPSYAETAIGSYNTLYTLQSINSGQSLFANDRIFSIGNGTSETARSNALTILKNGNTGIGTTTPTLAALVVDKNVGAVNAMFGSNSVGVAIEGNFPGIAFNSYYNNGRKAINTGYGSWIGLNPASGLLTIATSPTSITGQGSDMPLVDRLNIKPDGNIGIQGNTDPQSPLSFANTLGEKINFYHVGSTANYGIGVQNAQLQIHTGGAGDAISFGYGNSNAFTENMHIDGNGNVGIGGAAPYKLTVTKTGDGFYQQDATGAAAIGFYVNPTLAFLQTKTNTPLAFATNDASAQMLLGTNGNLKIGNATAATEKLEVAGNVKIVGNTNNFALDVVSNTNAPAANFSTGSSSNANIIETGTLGSGDLFNGFARGTGRGISILLFNSINSQPAVSAATIGTGPAIVASSGSSGANIAIFQQGIQNKARIDGTGKGFFNGGTQTGGADVAEAFAVEGNRQSYEPGDVLVISTNSDRTVTKSTEAYSSLVVGVYATKPGVLLTERMENDSMNDLVPMGVVGVIPTKVCAEGGAIHRGDLLVTSSTPGHAMKGAKGKIDFGTVIGKALEDFTSNDTGLIKVLVNVK